MKQQTWDSENISVQNEKVIIKPDHKEPERVHQKSYSKPALPDYLVDTYSWAYLNPKSVKILDRPWLVNLALLGNYRRLSEDAINEIAATQDSKTLQVACAYGELTPNLVRKLDGVGKLSVIDVAEIQLDNLKSKLPADSGVELRVMDSTQLDYESCYFDNVLLFFLLHEQPEAARKKTIEEALRVCKPGGQVVFFDYNQPRKRNLLGYVLRPVIKKIEPYALDLWMTPLEDHIENATELRYHVTKNTQYFGGFYKKITITKLK